jgi:hypothetical protein
MICSTELRPRVIKTNLCLNAWARCDFEKDQRAKLGPYEKERPPVCADVSWISYHQRRFEGRSNLRKSAPSQASSMRMRKAY